MAGGGDAQGPVPEAPAPQRAPDPFIRFLIPAEKPRRAAPTGPAALLLPPHRLIAPPPPVPEALIRPEERLFIVPPTRPDWLPPPRSYRSPSSPGPRLPVPPPPPPPSSSSRRYHSSATPGAAAVRPRPRPPFPPPRSNDPRARNVGRLAQFAGVHVNGARGGRSPAVPLPHDRFHPVVPLPHGLKAAAPPPPRKEKEKEKKAWVAVQRKAEGGGAGDEDRAAALSEGYSGGDEGSVEAAEDLLQPQDKGEQQQEDDDDGNRRLLPSDVHDDDDDVKSALPTDAALDCSGGGDRPIQVTPPPPDQVPRLLHGRTRRPPAECRRDMNALTPRFLALYESLKPSEDHMSKQRQFVDSLAKSVSKEWPNAQMHLYGSCANSFGTTHSDVDVCLEMETGDDGAVEVLLRLADVLRTDGFENVEAITGARVPIVRMSDPGSGLACDICIKNLFAVANTKLLKDYAQIDQRLLQLAFLVKHWAKQRGVNETYRGTLSSYAYVLMCINFLQQCEPKILPCLQGYDPGFAQFYTPYDLLLFGWLAHPSTMGMEPTYTMTVDGTECAYFDKVDQLQGFGADNKASIAELLWGFFHYWASEHHYKRDVISVRLGKTISKKEKSWTTRVGNDRHLVCIEDPFEVGHDLGRVVDRQTIRILREEMERAAAVLQYDDDDDPCVTLFEPYGYEN